MKKHIVSILFLFVIAAVAQSDTYTNNYSVRLPLSDQQAEALRSWKRYYGGTQQFGGIYASNLSVVMIATNVMDAGFNQGFQSSMAARKQRILDAVTAADDTKLQALETLLSIVP